MSRWMCRWALALCDRLTEKLPFLQCLKRTNRLKYEILHYTFQLKRLTVQNKNEILNFSVEFSKATSLLFWLRFLLRSFRALFPLNHFNLRNVGLIDDYFKIGQQWFCWVTEAGILGVPPQPLAPCAPPCSSSGGIVPWLSPTPLSPHAISALLPKIKKMWSTMISNLCSECAICPQMNWDIVATRHENDGKWGREKENVPSDRSACCDISPFNLPAASPRGLHIILDTASLLLSANVTHISDLSPTPAS